MFEKLLKDLKERFLNAETFLGAPTLIGVGVVFIVFQEYTFTTLGVACIGYGGYLFYVNRIKQEKKKQELVEND